MKTKWRESLFSRKWICRYIIAITVLSFIPLFLISQYDHPCADDFSYGNHTISVWTATHSLWDTINAAIDGTRQVYETWQGSFSAVFLMMLHPAIFGEQFYFLVPLFLLSGFILSILFFFKIIMIDYFGTDKVTYGIISCVILLLSVQFSISPVEAFYWYNGAIYYTGFHILSLIMFGTLLKSQKTNQKSLSILYGFIVVLSAFLVGGSNFITALTTAVILLIFFLYRIFCQKKTKWLLPLLGLLSITTSLLISISAPGNAIRQENFQGMNPFEAIFLSFWYALLFIFSFIRVPVFFAFACIVPLIYRMAKNSPYSFRLPGLVTVVLYGIYSSSFTPNLYAMSSFGMERVLNINFYLFLLFLFFTVFYWCGWISKKIPPAPNKTKEKNKRNSKENESFIILLIACFIFGSIMITSMDIHAMTSISSLYSLITGEASQYHQEYLNRLALYQNPKIKDVEVPAFQVKPYVLFFDDITTDINDWRNIAVASYYGKESVILNSQ